MVPLKHRYTNDHEWVSMQGLIATIGITDYAQEQLGDVVFVELPKVGAQLRAGEAFGSIESVKAVNDLLAPVSGEVTEINGTLASSPETVNKDPFGAGWLVKLRFSKPEEITVLMDAAGYESYVNDLRK